MPINARGSLLPAGEFITGVCRYSDFYPGLQEPLSRIYVPFQPDATESSYLALLDTGGHFCILSPEVADTVSDKLTDGFRETTLLTARGRVRGQIYRHAIKLLADEGEDLEIEATVLVSPDWRGPSVIGYTGVLDRINCAIDSQLNRFYFGPPV